MSLKFGSVCSGLDAASVAWTAKYGPLNWNCQFLSEIDKWPCASLSVNYPNIPNHGDMTKFEKWPDYELDVLIGGTPCQSYSVAGLRKGLDDPRGQLMLTFVAILARYRPRIFIWENVPGVLSSEKGRDFAAFLGAVTGQQVEPPKDGWKNTGCLSGVADAYGVAWRVLDAQHVRVDGIERAVPQRRRRVFVVGYIGDWRRAAGILLEPKGLCRDIAPRRGQNNAGDAVRSTTVGSLCARTGVSQSVQDATQGHMIATPFCDIAPTLNAHFGDKQGLENQHINGGAGLFIQETTPTLVSSGDGHSGFRDEQGLVPISIQTGNSKQNGKGYSEDGAAYTLDCASPQAVAFDLRGRDGGSLLEGPPFGRTGNSRVECDAIVATKYAVRRLTPTECERLQGFPDGFTNIPWAGKNDSPKGHRYKALGNSMAVNVIRWLGQRIEILDALHAENEIA